MSHSLPFPPFKQPPPPGLFQVAMGSELAHSPVTKIFPLARAVYGAGALEPSVLRNWYEINPDIFVTVWFEDALAGYLSCLPINETVFAQTLLPEFDEKGIVPLASCGGDYFGFLSSIVVHPVLQSVSPLSLLLRLAWAQKMLSLAETYGCSRWSITAQTLSAKGSGCMRSLGFEPRGVTTAGWQIECALLQKPDLERIIARMQERLTR